MACYGNPYSLQIPGAILGAILGAIVGLIIGKLKSRKIRQ